MPLLFSSPAGLHSPSPALAETKSSFLSLVSVREDDQVERSVGRLAGGIEGLYPHAFVVVEWPKRTQARTASQRHCDLASGFGKNTRSADGGDKGAVLTSPVKKTS
jgi:hypothetical protein